MPGHVVFAIFSRIFFKFKKSKAMKQMKTAVAGFMICAALLTACNKGSYDPMPGNATSPYSQAKAMDNGSMMFTAGSLSASRITVRSEGLPLADFTGPRTLELFDALANTGLPLQPRKYAAMETTIDIASSDGHPALLLHGNWMPIDEAGNTGEPVPVEFRIDAPMRLLSTSGMMILTENSNLLNLLNVQPERLATSIQREMWQGAVDPATGRIVISRDHNPGLYQLMLRNLGEMLEVIPMTGNPTDPGQNTSGAAVTGNPIL
jgi:hypothetical protein